MDEQNRERHKDGRLGEIFRHARRHEGVSQLYLAVSLGQKNVAFVSRLENGHVVPSLKTTKKIGKILNIPFATLADCHSQIQKQKVEVYLK